MANTRIGSRVATTLRRDPVLRGSIVVLKTTTSTLVINLVLSFPLIFLFFSFNIYFSVGIHSIATPLIMDPAEISP
jgi:hypothetical protein